MKIPKTFFSLRKVVLIAIATGVVVYMIVLPAFGMFLGNSNELRSGQTIEAATPLELLRVRSAKLAVFAVFAYVGACVGSFLNVVAASAPLGEPIALRDSACPKCKTPIRRIDNFPIVSYLRLRGRCRDCGVVIPIRYFVVELIAMGIFASLFLYELVTGAANIPGFQPYIYAGIVWIILYTKWPVVGVYLMHCALFSFLLTYALMEQDRLRLPKWMGIGVPLLFAGLIVAFPALLTVSIADQTPWQLPRSFPERYDRIAICCLGAVVGLVIGKLVSGTELRKRQSTALLVPAFTMIGIALGWQAVFTIGVFWFLAARLLKSIGVRRLRPRWLTATTLLFAITNLHHPFWKLLAEWISF